MWLNKWSTTACGLQLSVHKSMYTCESYNIKLELYNISTITQYDLCTVKIKVNSTDSSAVLNHFFKHR